MKDVDLVTSTDVFDDDEGDRFVFHSLSITIRNELREITKKNKKNPEKKNGRKARKTQWWRQRRSPVTSRPAPSQRKTPGSRSLRWTRVDRWEAPPTEGPPSGWKDKEAELTHRHTWRRGGEGGVYTPGGRCTQPPVGSLLAIRKDVCVCARARLICILFACYCFFSKIF